MSRLDWSDCVELAAFITDVEYWDSNRSEREINAEIEKRLCENFHIDGEIFAGICDALLPLVRVAEGGLTGTPYKGFANRKGTTWLLKTNVIKPMSYKDELSVCGLHDVDPR